LLFLFFFKKKTKKKRRTKRSGIAVLILGSFFSPSVYRGIGAEPAEPLPRTESFDRDMREAKKLLDGGSQEPDEE
jgi:hypothetical protein